MRSVKILMSVAVALLMGMSLAMSGCGGMGSGSGSVNIVNDQANPSDLESFIDSNKGKVVAAVLFKMDVPDCAPALQHLVELQGKYQDSQVAFVGVSLDADKEALRAYLSENEVYFPVMMIQAFADLSDGVPIVSLVDKDGNTHTTYEGLAEIQTMATDVDYLVAQEQ